VVTECCVQNPRLKVGPFLGISCLLHLCSKDSHSLMQAWVAAEWGLVVPGFLLFPSFRCGREQTDCILSGNMELNG